MPPPVRLRFGLVRPAPHIARCRVRLYQLYLREEIVKHLVWGILSLAIGAFLLFAALFLANVSVETNLIYGTIFVGYGVYRLNQYREARKLNSTQK